MFCLTSENLTGLGGQMGTERTWNNFQRFFSSLEKAKAYAEKDYKSPLTWKLRDGGWDTGDLMYVMYHIRKIKQEA